MHSFHQLGHLQRNACWKYPRTPGKPNSVYLEGQLFVLSITLASVEYTALMPYCGGVLASCFLGSKFFFLVIPSAL